MFSLEDLLGSTRRISLQFSLTGCEYDYDGKKPAGKPRAATLYVLNDSVALSIASSGCCAGGHFDMYAWRLPIVAFGTNYPGPSVSGDAGFPA